MKHLWLNKKNNENLIVFFNGWGMDEKIVSHLDYENYDVGCVINYLIDSDNYEVYMFIGSGSEMIASNIMCNIFKSKTDAINYYEELVNIIELNDLNAILDKVLQEKN